MELSEREQRDGMRWLYMAGLVAILFSFFLVWTDCILTHSKRDQKLGDILQELRGAQFSLGTGEVDDRLLAGTVKKP